jgi:hypothetical protein
MISNSSSGWLARAVIVASIAVALGLAAAPRSFAGCGGYCEARQARATCHHAVTVQGLLAQTREAEFEKCKADPTSYLQLEEITDAGEPIRE